MQRPSLLKARGWGLAVLCLPSAMAVLAVHAAGEKENLGQFGIETSTFQARALCGPAAQA